MKKILVVGSVSIDMVTSTYVLPKPGQTVIGNNFLTNIGGKGANQAFAAYYLGADVTFWGSVGNDKNADMVTEFFSKEGIKAVLQRKECSTGVATIIVNDNDSQNQIIIVPGANHSMTTEDVDRNLYLLENSDIIILQLENDLDTTWYIIEKAYELGKTIILNPAPAAEIPEDIIEKVDYLIPNETELEILTKDCPGDYVTKARYLNDIGARNVIITLGKKGSKLVTKEQVMDVPPFKVKAVDTTAAGDAYVGAFAFGLSEGWTMKEALGFASQVSSIAVTRKGAIMSLPHADEM